MGVPAGSIGGFLVQVRRVLAGDQGSILSWGPGAPPFCEMHRRGTGYQTQPIIRLHGQLVFKGVQRKELWARKVDIKLAHSGPDCYPVFLGPPSSNEIWLCRPLRLSLISALCLLDYRAAMLLGFLPRRTMTGRWENRGIEGAYLLVRNLHLSLRTPGAPIW
jgi:hypothetical protein